MKHLFLVIGLLLISLNLSAQTKVLKDVAATQELSKTVVKLFKEGKISKLFAELSPYWPMPQNEIDNVEQKTITQLNILKERYGEPFAYTKIRNEVISDFAIREIYFVQYENTAIRIMISYYKNESGWLVNGFKWDDSMSSEFR